MIDFFFVNFSLNLHHIILVLFFIKFVLVYCFKYLLSKYRVILEILLNGFPRLPIVFVFLRY